MNEPPSMFTGSSALTERWPTVGAAAESAEVPAAEMRRADEGTRADD